MSERKPAAHELIEWTVDELGRRNPELWAAFGEEGRQACRDEIAFLFGYLSAALEMGDAHPFLDCLSWQAEVALARDSDTRRLATSLSVLSEAFAQREEAWAREAATMLQKGLDALANKLRIPWRLQHEPDPLPSSRPYLEALLGGDRHQARDLGLGQMDQGCSFAEMGERLVQPAMYEIGSLWQQNRISVAQEHLATAITQFVLAQAYGHTQAASPKPKRALFANIETNHHALGLRIVADVFDLAGWDTQFLGSNVPTPALLSQVDLQRTDLLGLSISMPQQFAFARSAIAALRAEFGAHCPAVVLGGLAVNQNFAGAQRMGADLLVRSALEAEGLALVS